MDPKNSTRLALVMIGLMILLPASVGLGSAVATERSPAPAQRVRTPCAIEEVTAEYRAQYQKLTELRNARVGNALQSGPNSYATSLAAWEPAYEALERWRTGAMRRAAQTDSLATCGQ